MTAVVDACKATRTYLKGRITSLLKKASKCGADTVDVEVFNEMKTKSTDLKIQTEENYQEHIAAAAPDTYDEVTRHYQEMQDKLDDVDVFLQTCAQRFRQQKLVEEGKIRNENIQLELQKLHLAEKKLQVEKELEEKRIEKGVQGIPNNSQQPPQRPKLPQLSLPKFDGKFEEWLPFRDRYNQAVHIRSDLSGEEKFAYLLAALQGKAADAIKAIPLSNENYGPAYERVVKLFEHVREIAFKQ
ncbi:unnamed protein product [Allacma fusca]|uniref:Uncharacterized protein n=1 Tax=Allacma fusca TaxID=39272 RepID=A0A8J2JP92_9HEXA|nr:unnamed protein product [Allacma fusca]